MQLLRKCLNVLCLVCDNYVHVKKDKASVLNSTLEYMNLLIAEVKELNRRNQMLISQHNDQADTKNTQEIIGVNSLSSSNADNQRLDIRISNVAETTSEGRVMDLRVRVRGECNMADITIRVLEFLRQVGNVGLLSVEATTQMVGTTTVSDFIWRLKIEVSIIDGYISLLLVNKFIFFASL